jgi:AcrR family transcriptional regulator
MYHIKNDKRAERSAELICSAMLELINTKPFGEITVSDIQRVSYVSRSTFYRNFDCLTDVLELLCDRGFEGIFSKAAQQDFCPDLREEVFDYWFTNSRVPEELVQIHRTDIFLNSFRRSALELDSVRALASDSGRYDYLISMIVGVMVGVLVTWIEHGKTETKEEVRRIIQDEFDVISALGIMG